MSLISPKHVKAILWREGDDDNILKVIESGQMFKFEVAQTNKQEESVTVHQGFKAILQAIALPEAPTEDLNLMKPALIALFLLFGETMQGFMTVKHQKVRVMRDYFRSCSMEVMQLEGLL
ncbi:hypothetical protein J3R83DRAFT_11582 [Lanmaoa asiatica]|nr:hypothetical protein J3R83DRAFT_11582 [Lanmaoa asiatica]